jgi:hypothetical protein
MRIGLVTAVAALTLALAAWYLRADSESAPTANTPARTAAPAPAPAAVAAALAADSPADQPRPAAEAHPVVKVPGYAAQYLKAADMMTFLEALAPAAAEGDVDALYYLARASRRCTREYSTLFGPPGKEMTLEVALEKEYWTRYYEQQARVIHGQCRRFKAARDNPFTEWENLLAAAAEAGSGPAKALQVFEMSQGMIRVHDPAERTERKDEIRRLAKEALRTKDPEVLHFLAYVESISGSAGTAADVAGAWMLAACQRGLECGRDSEQFQFFCRWDPACRPSETMVDLFRRRARFEEFQLIANELNAKLDADRFDEIIP